MKTLSRITALIAVCFALAAMAAMAARPAVAAEPLVYDSTTGYAGAGKHPKTAVAGLILDGRTAGLTFVCYDYILITNDKIKGEISGVAERISGSRVERIATFSKMKVQPFDISQVPPGGDDACAPDPGDLPDFNFGIAGDCVEIGSSLAAGDIVRWTFKFKKSSKLKGQDAFVQVSGAVLPLAGLAADGPRAKRALSWIDGSHRDRLPRRGTH